MSGAETFAAIAALGSVVTTAWAVRTSWSNRTQAEAARQVMNTQFAINRAILTRLWEASEAHDRSHRLWKQLIDKDAVDSSKMAAMFRQQKQQFLSMTRVWIERSPAKWKEWAMEFSPDAMREMCKENGDDAKVTHDWFQTNLEESKRLLRTLEQPSLKDRIKEVDKLFLESQQLLIILQKFFDGHLEK